MNIADLLDTIEIRAYQYLEGDILVLKNTEIEINHEQAAEIKAYIRHALGIPDLKILVLGRDWELEVAR